MKIIIIYRPHLIDIKKVNSLVKHLTSQKKIEIDYKIINSDINFKNKEKQLKINIDSFILNILENFNKS